MQPTADPEQTKLEQICRSRGVWMGDYRRSILRVLAGALRHGSVDQIHRALQQEHPRLRLATVYRTVKILEEAGALVRHDFGDGFIRYETADLGRHDHLVDRRDGTVIEFRDDSIGRLLHGISTGLGYRLANYRLNLYGVPLSEDAPPATVPPSGHRQRR